MTRDELIALRLDPEKLEAFRISLRDELILAAEKSAIKFEPFTQDIVRGKYDAAFATDVYEWALIQAQAWHVEAIAQMGGLVAFRVNGKPVMKPGWNHGVPYCRNIPTPEMFEEAGL